MPPAFALSQDQTLRFIQASPCNQSHTATPKRTSKGSALSPITSQPTPNNQAPSHNTQNTYPQRSTHPGADRASHPATHRNKAKTHSNKAQHSTTQRIAKHYQLPKKPDAIVKQQKKTSNRTPYGIPSSRPPQNSTNRRQGKNISQYTSASQAQKTTKQQRERASSTTTEARQAGRQTRPSRGENP